VKRKHDPRALFVLIFLCAMLGATSVFAENIKIGVLLPLSGRLYDLGGEISYKSFLMAAREINEANEMGGHKIELVLEDTYGDRETGVASMEKLISQDNVLLVTGGFSSTVTWLASEVAEEHQVPFLVCTASADRITEARRRYVFRINTPAGEQSRPLGSFVEEVAKVETASILYEESFFGRFWSRKIMRQFKGLGLNIVLEKSFLPGTGDFRPLLSLLGALGPDLVYMIAQVREARLIMQQAREVSLNPRLFVGHEAGFSVPEFGEMAGGASEFVYSPAMWSPALPYPGAGDYYDRFIENYGARPDYHGAQAYSAMQVIADALGRADSLDPEGLRKGLSETQLMTVLGPVAFRSYGKKSQQNRLPSYLMQWIDSELKPVWPPAIARDKYVYPTPRWEDRAPRIF